MSSHFVPPVDKTRRRELARQALGGYVNGPDAPTQATERALVKAEQGHGVVLVEGISDQIALETLALRYTRDLNDEGVVVLPVGGAHAMAKYLNRFGPGGDGKRLAGLCDAAEEDLLKRALSNAGVGSPRVRSDMERLGFFVCVEDLEEELIRSVGSTAVLGLFDRQGDLGSFRTLQSQPEWRGGHIEAQMRRFLGSGARRKLRYARLLVDALDLDRVPHPLSGVLAAI